MAGIISQISGWLGLAEEAEALPPRSVSSGSNSSSESRPVTRIAPRNAPSAPVAMAPSNIHG